MREGKIKILVTDDSLSTRMFLVKMLSMDPAIEVIGTANDGMEALEFIRRKKPDVVTMGIYMPRMDGFEATLKIMHELPVPIVIVSNEYSLSETTKKFKALEAGAVAILPLPFGVDHPDYESSMKHFVSTVKLMSEVKLIRRWKPATNKFNENVKPKMYLTANDEKELRTKVQIIVIGASAGGPIVVKKILDHLTPGLSVPIIIVQHIDSEFAQGYADWLNLSSGVKVVIAKDGELMEPGKVYMAPGDHHIGVKSLNTIMISKAAPENGLRPSVSFLFRSIRNVYNDQTISILLSGMGADGASELKMLKDAGSVTIAQDALSSLIHGMPGEAIKLGGASYVFSPDQIIQFIQKCIPTLSK